MPMVKRGTGELPKFRLLVSGFGMSGKTKSFETFIEEGKSVVVLVCPGEPGIRSLPEDSEYFTSYYFEGSGTDVYDPKWSEDALAEWEKTYSEIERNSPDKLFIDGIHWWYAHNLNVITGGEFLSGVDMSVSVKTGRIDPYRAANMYTRGRNSFGQRLAGLSASPIPFLGITCLEAWEAARTDSDRPGGIDAVRYLWPALPGEMATQVVSRFDARVSARLEKRCLHKNCEYSKNDELHFVWQFYPKNDVMGVGIKGLHVSESMRQRPYIHQTWPALKGLLGRV